MPAISDRKPKLVTATVALDDFEFTIRFDSRKLTPRWFAEANHGERIPALVAEVVDAWDVTAADGSEFPPTAENLSQFTFDELGRLVELMVEASTPSRAEGNASVNTSSSASMDSSSEQANPLNGRTPSLSPQPLASPSTT